MAQILLIVEGQTEEQFYKRLVQDEFRNEDGTFRHYFQVVVMPSKKNIYSRGQKGGSISYDVCINNIKRFLRQASHCEMTLLVLDYYGLHNSFKNHLYTERSDLKQRVQDIQNRLETEIGSSKFKFRLQVHEFEAYLFSAPETVVSHFQQPQMLDALRKILDSFHQNPELVNDHPSTAPSKRLKTLFPNFGKTTDGIAIAEKTGISNIRASCSLFNQMCHLFEELG